MNRFLHNSQERSIFVIFLDFLRALEVKANLTYKLFCLRSAWKRKGLKKLRAQNNKESKIFTVRDTVCTFETIQYSFKSLFVTPEKGKMLLCIVLFKDITCDLNRCF